MSDPVAAPDGGTALRRLRSGGGYFPLTGRARFAISGADRLRYLNGQLSNDLRKLVPDAALEACMLSTKGKLDGVVFVWLDGETIVVECAAEIAETIGARLERYVVADDVVIEPVAMGEELHVFGAAAAEVSTGRAIQRLGEPGRDVFASNVTSDWTEATPAQLELLRIERLLPAWGHELGSDTLPAEAGLDKNAVDFHKGCYIGQEVVSRIQSVGHANRALYSFRTPGPAQPASGESIVITGAPEKPVGVVTSAALHFELSAGVGLCYIKRGVDSASPLESSPSAIPIQLCQLPCDLSLRP